jgi:hypothetical protein
MQEFFHAIAWLAGTALVTWVILTAALHSQGCLIAAFVAMAVGIVAVVISYE